MRSYSYQLVLFFIFLLVWIWAAIDPLYPRDWLLENILVFLSVPLIVLTAPSFQLSKLSYTLITIFAVLHLIGSHYTYSETPLGLYLQELCGAERNMYDRFVHGAFGLLITYPVREIFLRIAHVKGIWGYVFPFSMIAAFSLSYEIIEWLVAAQVEPDLGLAFLGVQGDVWDTQKDSLAATLGSLITLGMVFFVNLWLDPKFLSELKASFRIPPSDTPIGEVRLKTLWGKRKV